MVWRDFSFYVHHQPHGPNPIFEAQIATYSPNSSPFLTNIGLFESGRVVDTVASDGDDGTQILATLDDDEFLLRRRPGKDNLRMKLQDIVYLPRGHLLQLTTVNHSLFGLPVCKRNWRTKGVISQYLPRVLLSFSDHQREQHHAHWLQLASPSIPRQFFTP